MCHPPIVHHPRSMSLPRYIVLIALCLNGLSPLWADPRAQAIAKAAAHTQPAPEPLLSALCFVVIGYEGNLPLFKAGVVPPPKNGTGIAIPVDAAGYFLTAAHSVQPDQTMYVMGVFGGEMKALQAAIVYRGDPSRVESDFAILKVEQTLPYVIPFAASLPGQGDAVFAAVRLGSSTTLAKGSCSAAPAPSGPQQNAWLANDIPAVAGDSGGPLLSPDFQFIGLTSRAGGFWGLPRTLSCCPAAKFVQATIARWKTTPPTQEARP